MFEVDSSIALSAPVGRVWRVLSDFNHYRDWHPFISLTGKGAFESILELEHKTRIPLLMPIRAQARVIRYVPNTSVAWQMRVGRLITVEEGFDLVKSDDRTECAITCIAAVLCQCSGLGWSSAEWAMLWPPRTNVFQAFSRGARRLPVTRHCKIDSESGTQNEIIATRGSDKNHG